MSATTKRPKRLTRFEAKMALLDHARRWAESHAPLTIQQPVRPEIVTLMAEFAEYVLSAK